MAYDRFDWHYGSDDYPSDLPSENGGTHIGIFLAWAIINNLEGEELQEDSKESLDAVRQMSMTGREFLIKECDEKFWDIDLNDEGNDFAKHYYETNDYIDDYSNILDNNLPSLYHVKDNWDNYNKMSVVISERYNKWKIKQNKNWWEFWK